MWCDGCALGPFIVRDGFCGQWFRYRAGTKSGHLLLGVAGGECAVGPDGEHVSLIAVAGEVGDDPAGDLSVEGTPAWLDDPGCGAVPCGAVRLAGPVGRRVAGSVSRSRLRLRGVTGGPDDGGRRVPAAGVQPEWRVGVGHQRGVRGDPQYPPVQAQDEVVRPWGYLPVTARTIAAISTSSPIRPPPVQLPS